MNICRDCRWKQTIESLCIESLCYAPEVAIMWTDYIQGVKHTSVSTCFVVRGNSPECPHFEKRPSLKEMWFGWLTRGKGQTE